jgi:hypothetical protein
VTLRPAAYRDSVALLHQWRIDVITARDPAISPPSPSPESPPRQSLR